MKTLEQIRAYNREKQRIWRAKNPGKEKRKYHANLEESRLKGRVRGAKWRKKNPNYSPNEHTRLKIKAYQRAYRLKHADKERARSRVRRKANKLHFKSLDLKNKYGIDLTDYQNLMKAQDYKCAICKKLAADLTRSLAVDHCHRSSKVRGLLCGPCNLALGLLKDNREVLWEAIQYLTRAEAA